MGRVRRSTFSSAQHACSGLCTVPATLTMAVSIPHSFHEWCGHRMWFGIAYMAVQLLVLAHAGHQGDARAATRKAFIDYASFASIAPVLVVAGGFAHDGVAGVWSPPGWSTSSGDCAGHRESG